MKRIRFLTLVLFALLLVLCMSAAYAADVRPLEPDPDKTDLNNGEFRLTITDPDQVDRGGYFTASLYLEDRLFGTAEAENGTAVFENVPLRMGENRLTALSGKCRDDCVLERVVSPDPSYALPEAEGAVTNWFLQGDAYTRQGYLSIQTRTDQLLDTPAAREVLREKIPALFQTLTETKVIPLGLSLKGILEHENTPKEMLEDINAALNQIPDED